MASGSTVKPRTTAAAAFIYKEFPERSSPNLGSGTAAGGDAPRVVTEAGKAF